MADEASKIASTPQGAVTVENRYLKIREKKSKTGTSKILKNISVYSQLVSKRQFAGTLQRSKKRLIDDNINRRARDAGVGVQKILVSSNICQYLVKKLKQVSSRARVCSTKSHRDSWG